MTKKQKGFSSFCFASLCFCLLIILWGAWVRISHSGDGCGQSWPSCQGQYLISIEEEGKTWIEWIHRATSGLFGVMVLGLLVWAFLKFPRRHPVRKSTLLAFCFTLSEALIGARLVLAGLTGSSASWARALTMNLHLLNSVLLTCSLFITWRLSLGQRFSFSSGFFSSVFSKFSKRKHIIIFILIFFLIAFFGSFSSLSAGLFPSSSLWKGLSMDFNPDSHWLIRWRLLHPVLALIFGGGFFLYYIYRSYDPAGLKMKNSKSTALKWLFKWVKPKNFLNCVKKVKNPSKIFVLCLSLALLSGLMNLLLLSPVFLKFSHLLMVYLLSLSFILTLEKKQKTRL